MNSYKPERIFALVICLTICIYSGLKTYKIIESNKSNIEYLNKQLDNRKYLNKNGNTYSFTQIKRFADRDGVTTSAYIDSKNWLTIETDSEIVGEQKIKSITNIYILANLFAFVFVFCTSLFCFTYICVKK